MARKVFISVLGTGYYNRTNYYWQTKGNYIETRFIQEATMKLFTNNWDDNDKAYFFLTQRARETNWTHPAQINDRRVKDGERDTYKGLELRIKECGIKYGYEVVTIPDGNNEQEIWQIFEEVFNVFEDEDEVYFDITHAFRSIPMLVMVLINYAKFLKKIKVKSITYGNWEGRDKDENFAPIIDITAFSELQDWTSAANDFVNFGNVNKLSKLAKNDISPLARQFKGKNETVKSLIKISKYLPVFIDNIHTCRGKNIIKNTEGVLINNELKNIKENLISPLTPILNKVENKLFPFDENDNLIENTHQIWQNEAWLNSYRYQYQYEGDNNTLLLYQYWENDIFKNSYRYQYFYFEVGLPRW